MTKPSVLLLFGGESSEHEVSVASTRNVFDAIDKRKYEIKLCYIDSSGRWWSLKQLDDKIETAQASQLAPNLGRGCLVSVDGGKEIQIDVILPILHGKNGEDGSVQGLAQLLHVPIVGCDMTASAIAMDKVATKSILSSQGFSITPFRLYRRYEDMPSFDDISALFGGESVFVKPSRAGSSIGAGRADNQSSLDTLVGEALVHDDVVLLEQALDQRQELEVAILGNPPDHIVSSVGEMLPGADFYSYEAKYSATSHSEAVIPSNAPDEIIEQIRSQAKQIFEILGCRGLARIDFFLSVEGKLYFNEINTIPGFTNISMYPKLWQHDGVSYAELIDRLISSALK